MVQEDIRTMAEYAHNRQNYWRLRLHDLQEECSHPDVEKEAKASTGNYDPSADSYWYNCYCPDCGKQWREDQ